MKMHLNRLESPAEPVAEPAAEPWIESVTVAPIRILGYQVVLS